MHAYLATIPIYLVQFKVQLSFLRSKSHWSLLPGKSACNPYACLQIATNKHALGLHCNKSKNSGYLT